MLSYESAVFRVVESSEAECCIGTAFSISTSSLLTCHHVIANIDVAQLSVLDCLGQSWSIAFIEYPTDSQSQDFAIIHLKHDVSDYLPLYASDEDPKEYNLLGYIEGDTSKVASEYKLEVRKRKDVEYGGYCLPVAIEMVGDPVGGGLSGSPLINPENNCVSAIFCGGNIGLGRAWALPFSETLKWENFQTLYGLNDHAVAKFYSALNERGALEVCSRKTKQTLDLYLNASKYDASLNVERTNLNKSLEDFYKSNKTVFALVGDANVGKSWALCDFVEQCHTKYPTLLINAAFETFHKLNMQPDEFCDQLLSCQNKNGERKLHFTELSNLCKKKHLPLMIVIDGINEVDNFSHFLNHWLPALIVWCSRKEVKLVLSCRSEKWVAVSRRLSSMRDEIYDIERPVITELGKTSNKSDHFLLQEFSIDEANVAVKRYGLQQQQLHKLGRHPLSFKIARSLDFSAIPEQLSKYGMIYSLIEHQLNDAADALTSQNHHWLWSQIRSIANSATANTGGLIEWSEALQLLNLETLHALVDCGLLVSDMQALKFTYDEVSDFLQDVPKNSLQLLQTPLSEVEFELDQNGLYHAILHYEYSKNEKAFSEHISALHTKLAAIGDITQDTIKNFGLDVQYNHISPVLELTFRLIKSLPASRQNILKNLLSALCNAADVWYLLRHRVQHLIELVLDNSDDIVFQMTQLLKLLHLDDSWPLRMKDWLEPSRRLSFVSILPKSNYFVASAIIRLYEETPNVLRPKLIKALSDKTNLVSEFSSDATEKIGKGEATVDSACAGILYCFARNDDESLIAELLQSHTRASSTVIRILAEDDPDTVANSLINCLNKRELLTEFTLSIIGGCIHQFNDSDKQIISGLYDRFRTSLSADSDKVMILSVLRRLYPANSDYWNELFDILSDDKGGNLGHQLIPVPVDCFARLYELIDCSPSLLCDIIKLSIQKGKGKSPELAELVMSLLNNNAFMLSREEEVGAIVESILWKSFADKKMFDIWFCVIFSVTKSARKKETLDCIIYAVFNDIDYYNAFESVINVLMLNPKFGKCLSLVFNKISSEFHIQNHVNIYRKFRDFEKNKFDKALFINNMGCSDEKALSIIQFWQTYSSQCQSELSRRIIDLHNDPTFIDNPLSFDSYDFLREYWLS